MKILPVHPNDPANGPWRWIGVTAILGFIITAMSTYGAVVVYTQTYLHTTLFKFVDYLFILFTLLTMPGLLRIFWAVSETIKKVQQNRYLKHLDDEFCSHIVRQ